MNRTKMITCPPRKMPPVIGKIICGDNCDVLGRFPDDCIDLVVTSPPYDDLRTYGGHPWDFYGVAWQLKRVLKPGGVIVWVVADQTKDGSETGSSADQAKHFRVLGLRLHDTMIYKANKPPQNGNRYEPCWEYMFVFSKGKPAAWNAQYERTIGPGAVHTGGMRGKDGKIGARSHSKPTGVLKVRENIWYLPRSSHSDGKERHEHPATFPDALAADHIKTWSNEGDLVLDPFNGSGTTTAMACKLKRKFIGIEVDPTYCKLAVRRMGEKGFFA